MKLWLPTIAMVAAFTSPALAQDPPAPGSSPGAMGPPPGSSGMARPNSPQMEAMEKLHGQLDGLRLQERLTMLGSLSAAHRSLLANIMGQLAVANSPDPRAAEAQIDAMLTPAEKQSILTAEVQARSSSESLMETARAQFEAGASADERAKMQARDSDRAAARTNRPRMSPGLGVDAGRTLLRTLTVGDGVPGGFGRIWIDNGMMPGPGHG